MAPTPSEVFSYMADRADKGGAPVPIGGDIMGLLVALASISVLSICLYQRCTAIKVWNSLPLVVWPMPCATAPFSSVSSATSPPRSVLRPRQFVTM
ncbi:hypothetical protein AUP68_03373 [Ilyonectria robusta]